MLLASACDDDGDDGDTGDTAADSGAEGSGGSEPDDDSDDSDDSDDVDNVASCMAFVDELECGATDFGQFLPCSDYAALDCDLSPYLDCLADNFSCEGEVFDASGWTMCTSLATCT